jgi:copper(I)-binding protein
MWSEMKIVRAAMALAVVVLLPTPLIAVTAPAQDAGPRIEQPWARATPGNARTGAVYMTIEPGAAPDKLLAVATPVAGRAELHAHIMDNGVMQMRAVDTLAVQPGSPAVLKPGGYHVMLFDLKQPLKEGEEFPLTLTFGQAGAKQVTVHVEKAGAMGPGGVAASHQDGGNMHNGVGHDGMKH